MATGTGGDVLAQILAAEGVDTAFGIVDGTYVQLCASMREHGIELVGRRVVLPARKVAEQRAVGALFVALSFLTMLCVRHGDAKAPDRPLIIW